MSPCPSPIRPRPRPWATPRARCSRPSFRSAPSSSPEPAHRRERPVAPKLCMTLLVAAWLGVGAATAQQGAVDVGAVSREDSTKKLAAAAPGDSTSVAADPTESAVFRESFAYGGA